MGNVTIDRLSTDTAVTVMVTENGRRMPLVFRLEGGHLGPDATSLTHWFLRAWCAAEGREACDELIALLRGGGLRLVEAGGVQLEVNPFLCRLRFTAGEQASPWVEVPTLDLLNALRELRNVLPEPAYAA